MSRADGVFELVAGGHRLKIIYDWSAIAEMEEKYTHEQIFFLLKTMSVKACADVILMGLRRHHPEITKEWLFEQSIPIVPAIQAIDSALSFAYFGTDERSSDGKDSDSDTKKKKKNPLRRLFGLH